MDGERLQEWEDRDNDPSKDPECLLSSCLPLKWTTATITCNQGPNADISVYKKLFTIKLP